MVLIYLIWFNVISQQWSGNPISALETDVDNPIHLLISIIVSLSLWTLVSKNNIYFYNYILLIAIIHFDK